MNKPFLFSFCFTMAGLNYFLFPDTTFVLFDLIITGSLISLVLALNKKGYGKRKIEKIKPKLFLWGKTLVREESQDEENDFLRKVVLQTKAKRLVLSIVSLLLVSSLYISFFSYSHASFAGFAFLIVSSTYIGHLYFIGLAKILLVLCSIGYSDTIDSLELYALGMLCFQFILFFSEGEKNYKVKSFLLFFVIFSSMQFLLPENFLAISQEIKKQEMKIIKHKRRNSFLNNLAKKKAKSLLHEKNINLSTQLKSLDKSLESLEKAIENLNGFSGIEKLGKTLLGESQVIKLEIEDLRKQIKSLENKKELNDSDIEQVFNIIKRLEELERRVNKLSSGFKSSDKENLLNNLSKNNSRNESNNNLSSNSAIKDLDENIRKASSQMTAIREKVKKSTIEKIIKLKNKENEWKSRIDLVKIFEKFSLALLACLLLGVLKLFLSKFKPENFSTFTKSERKTLKRSLKVIKAKNLSPNQEIFESYNVFKDLLKETIYTQFEVPPPSKLLETRIGTPELQMVTELFNKCFYGSYRANSKDIKSFRLNFKKLLF